MRYIEDDFNDTTILITGGAGFIGSNLAYYFQENHPKVKVVVLDIFRSNEKLSNGSLKSFGYFKNLIDFKGEIICGDIKDKNILDVLCKNYRFDYIFHEAGITDTTYKEQTFMMSTNLSVYKNLLDIAVDHKATMIYASSSDVYGDAKSPQCVGRENPQNIYGFSKLAMDNLTKEYIKKSDISIVGLRYFNAYGKNEFFKGESSSIILQLGIQFLSNKSLEVRKKNDKVLHDFTYIEDIIQANIKAMKAKKSGIYNIGTGRARSFEDIIEVLEKKFKTKREIYYNKNSYLDRYSFFTQADIEISKWALEYKPMYNLEDGIEDYLDYIQKIYEQEVK